MSITLKSTNKSRIIPAVKIKGGQLDGIELNINKTKSKCPNKSDTYFELTEDQLKEGSELKYIFNGRFRNCVFIAAPSGCGKSYLAGQLIKQWRKRWYNNTTDPKGYKFKGRIYLISPKKHDEPLDKEGVFRIDINEHNFIDEDTKLTIDDFENSLMIFDDYEALPKRYRDAVMDLIREVLLTGRSKHISTIIITHNAVNGHETKNLISESDTIIIFPNSGLRYQYKRLINEYCGFNNAETRTLLDLPTDRYITIHKPDIIFVSTPKYLYTRDYITKITKDKQLAAIRERAEARRANKN